MRTLARLGGGWWHGGVSWPGHHLPAASCRVMEYADYSLLLRPSHVPTLQLARLTRGKLWEFQEERFLSKHSTHQHTLSATDTWAVKRICNVKCVWTELDEGVSGNPAQSKLSCLQMRLHIFPLSLLSAHSPIIYYRTTSVKSWSISLI